MKILVTGASGFVGGRIAESLCYADMYDVYGLGRSEKGAFNQNLPLTYYSLDLSKSLPPLDFDICIHAAGLADDTANELSYFENNVVATKNLLSALHHCQCFIYISSASVYDFSDGAPKKESDTYDTDRLSPYGRSKRQAEQIVFDAHFPSIYVLRPRAIYGKGDRVLMPRILKLIKGKMMFLPGSLNVSASLTHIDNLMAVVKSFILQQKKGVSTFNICDNRIYSLRDVFKAIKKSKTGDDTLISVPLPIIRMLIFFQLLFNIKSNLNTQSINYLTQSSVLDITKLKAEMNYIGTEDFYNFIEKK